eukprot:gb/GFBE01078238.1/.p1 GENE.gb/GFBE01078238.1/~~gb/GFBE01078238.1/.p1  ORF type:complete len:105 (+),score=5.25 gb/GFBE01078238.1/:1-315(+)
MCLRNAYSRLLVASMLVTPIGGLHRQVPNGLGRGGSPTSREERIPARIIELALVLEAFEPAPGPVESAAHDRTAAWKLSCQSNFELARHLVCESFGKTRNDQNA